MNVQTLKYAFMTASCPDLEFAEVLALARQDRYDGIELRVSNDHKHGVEFTSSLEERKIAKQDAADAGVALCCVATSCRFADPETVAAALADTHLAIDLAGDLEAPCVRIFGGVIGTGLSRDEAVDSVVRAMNDLKEHAGDRGVRLGLETHDDWCDPAHLVRVVQEVDHDAVGINWDLMHPVMTADQTIDEAFEAVKPWLVHVHFHDGYWEGEGKNKRVMAPMGEGVIDHRRALQLLHSINYDGFVSGEWIRWKPHSEYLAQELETLKSYEAELRGTGRIEKNVEFLVAS